MKSKISVEGIFTELWNDYLKMTPQAKKIHDLLDKRGESVDNDHIAFRTFDDSRVSLDMLSKIFLDLGYKKKDYYYFEVKKLEAYYFAHQKNPRLPKIFISHLQLDKFSPWLRDTVTHLLDQMEERDPQFNKDPLFCVKGRSWNISYKDYKRLLEESEYAAWLAAFGFRANHFTVLVNSLKSFSGLEELNRFLKESGFVLNSSGGEIKGSKEVCLEQSSTMASKVEVNFSDGNFEIPSCYYEFAKRYVMPKTQELFQGFVENSADKIFESTNHKKNM